MGHLAPMQTLQTRYRPSIFKPLPTSPPVTPVSHRKLVKQFTFHLCPILSTRFRWKKARESLLVQFDEGIVLFTIRKSESCISFMKVTRDWFVDSTDLTNG